MLMPRRASSRQPLSLFSFDMDETFVKRLCKFYEWKGQPPGDQRMSTIASREAANRKRSEVETVGCELRITAMAISHNGGDPDQVHRFQGRHEVGHHLLLVPGAAIGALPMQQHLVAERVEPVHVGQSVEADACDHRVR